MHLKRFRHLKRPPRSLLVESLGLETAFRRRNIGIFSSFPISLLRVMFQSSAPPSLSSDIRSSWLVLGTADPVLPNDIVPRYPSRVRHPPRRYLPEYGIWS